MDRFSDAAERFLQTREEKEQFDRAVEEEVERRLIQLDHARLGAETEARKQRAEQAARNTVREGVWVRAWCAVGQAVNATQPDVATSWADACLAAFDKRFGLQEETDYG